MSGYDLKSLDLPKLYGSMLNVFADVVGNTTTRKLLINSLMENGGIPKLRKVAFQESPAFYPLEISAQRAQKGLPAGQLKDVRKVARSKIPHHTIRDYAEAYQAGALTPLNVAEKFLQDVEANNRAETPLNAFIAIDREDLIKQAQASTERIRKGRPISIFDGVPVAIKDEIDQTPYPTTVGTRFLGSQPAQADATVVERLRAAGALLVGKTNMHEIGINPNGSNAHHGRVANPYALNRDTGGSSSGSAAAVAAGLCPVAIGADGGGSIRIPAALCGMVGLKATFGRVSEKGAAPLCWSVAHIGPIGASVEDVMLAYSAIAGPDAQDINSTYQPPVTVEGWDKTDLKGVTAGIFSAWFDHADPEVVKINRSLVDDLMRAGLKVKEIEVPELDMMRIAHSVTILAEMAACMRSYPKNFKDFSASTRLSLVLGQEMTAYEYIQAQRMRTRALATFKNLFAGVDVILSPATALPAPLVPAQALSNGWSDLSTDIELMRFIYPGNLAGLPGISFPAGYTPGGIPVGMHAMGRHWEEHLLLRVAHVAEQVVKRHLPANHFKLMP